MEKLHFAPTVDAGKKKLLLPQHLNVSCFSWCSSHNAVKPKTGRLKETDSCQVLARSDKQQEKVISKSVELRASGPKPPRILYQPETTSLRKSKNNWLENPSR